jgi:hypothetical protein
MEERQKKAFDFAVDLTKQLITLATVIITLTVTFSKDIIGVVDDSNRTLLLLSWIVFIISILFGILTLMALTGNLDPIPKKQPKDDTGSMPDPVAPSPNLTITSSNVTSTAKLQIYTFLIALALTVTYGYNAASSPEKSNNSDDNYIIIRETRLNADSTAYIDTLYVPKSK